MQCLDVLGFMDCYYLDIDKIYNAKRKQYMTEVGEYRYKIRTTEGTVMNILDPRNHNSGKLETDIPDVGNRLNSA